MRGFLQVTDLKRFSFGENPLSPDPSAAAATKWVFKRVISTKLSTTSAKAAWRHVLAPKSVCGRGLSTNQGRLVILLKKFVAAFGFF
jgi:hypothetical protein